MSYKILNTPEFKKEIKRLSSKYPSLQSDFKIFLNDLSGNPFQGKALGNNCYKSGFRLQVKDGEKVKEPE